MESYRPPRSFGFNFWTVHPFVPRIYVCESVAYEENESWQFMFRC